MNEINTLHIFLIEDNPGDVFLTKDAFQQSEIPHEFDIINDGEVALNIFSQEALQNRPDLILLDLNLPKIDGKELLHTIRSNPALKTIPVIVLSSSRAEQDVSESYKLDASCYMTKPLNKDKISRIFKCIKEKGFNIPFFTGLDLNECSCDAEDECS